MTEKPKKNSPTYNIVNRKAKFDYEFIETFEAGMVLTGSEVKSLRLGQASVAESYIRVQNNEAFLIGSFFAPYEQAGPQNHDPTRTRKLLLHKREIVRLATKVKEKGLTIIPLKVYFSKRGQAKLEIALAKGKITYDKRQTIKNRDMDRQMSRELKKYR
jgi:SsrA-binding protein